MNTKSECPLWREREKEKNINGMHGSYAISNAGKSM